MEHVILANTIVPSNNNSPTREGEVVNSVTDIPNIELPFIGMPVFVLDEWKLYRVKTLNKDLDRCVEYVEDSSGDVAGVFKWKGEKNSVEDLENETATAQAGDTWSVKDSGNYCFVPESVKLSLNDSSKEVPQGFASAFRKNDDGTISIEVSPNKFETATLAKKSADPDNYDYYLISQEGKQYVYYNNGIGTQLDGGPDAIVMTTVSSHWVSMGGNAVTQAEVENSINTAKTELSTSFTSSLNNKQNTLSDTQMKAVNSGITKTILDELKDGCLASADETNGLIKVKISGTDSYMYVKAAKLTAPSLDMGDTIRYATSATYNITLRTDSDAVIYYTTDGTEPSETSSHATGSVDIAVSNCLAQKSKQVTVKAYAIKNGLKTTQSTTYTIKRKLKVTISAGSSTDYSTTRPITLTTNSTGATIKRGNTESSITTAYTAPFNITSTTTIYAKATKVDWEDSDVTSVEYTVGKDVEIYYGFAKIQPTDVTTLPQKKQGSNITSFKSDNTYTDSHSDSTKRYMWFAILSTLTTTNNGATSGGFEFPFEMEGNTPKKYTIGKYAVYRSAQEIQQGSKTVNFK